MHRLPGVTPAGVNLPHRAGGAPALNLGPTCQCLRQGPPGGVLNIRLVELKRQAPQNQALLGRFGAINLAVLGSVAKDQASADSAVDLLVDLPDGTSLFDRAELKSALEELLLTRVDLNRRRNLKLAIKAIVAAEAITL